MQRRSKNHRFAIERHREAMAARPYLKTFEASRRKICFGLEPAEKCAHGKSHQRQPALRGSNVKAQLALIQPRASGDRSSRLGSKNEETPVGGNRGFVIGRSGLRDIGDRPA